MTPAPPGPGPEPAGLEEPLVLDLSAEHPGRLTVQPIRHRREQSAATFALAGALRSCPKWRGPGRIEVVITRPDVLARALEGRTALADARALEEAAGVAWLLPPDFREGVIHLQEWLARFRDHLTALLRKRNTRAQRRRR